MTPFDWRAALNVPCKRMQIDVVDRLYDLATLDSASDNFPEVAADDTAKEIACDFLNEIRNMCLHIYDFEWLRADKNQRYALAELDGLETRLREINNENT